MSSRNLAIALCVIAPLLGCAALPGIGDDPDHALCEQARALADRGDPASAVVLLDHMRDLRNYHRCRYDLMQRDRGIEPNST
ncbi:MAG: hypothetical protein RIS35_2334 [Pseudomonadota bacterium]